MDLYKAMLCIQNILIPIYAKTEQCTINNYLFLTAL